MMEVTPLINAKALTRRKHISPLLRARHYANPYVRLKTSKRDRRTKRLKDLQLSEPLLLAHYLTEGHYVVIRVSPPTQVSMSFDPLP